MSEDMEKYYKMGELIFACLDGQASDEQFASLKEMLSSDAEAMQYYAEFVIMYTGLKQQGNFVDLNDISYSSLDGSVDGMLWKALAESEKSAVGIEVEKQDTQKDDSEDKTSFDQRRRAIKRRKRVSRLSLYTAICSTAALLLVIMYVFFVPEPPPVVAVLTDSFGAKWADTKEPLNVGCDLRTGAMQLVEGFAKITFYDGAEIIVQAPSSFDLESDSQVYVSTGTVTGRISKHAVGFVVRTPTATVVDYGTEFGVTVSGAGQTEAHVFKGKVELRAGSDPILHGAAKMLNEGIAGLVDSIGNIKQMKAQKSRFVRTIPSRDSICLPGKCIDLADIVAGGNGFGSSGQKGGIDPVTGNISTEINYTDQRLGSSRYVTVPDSPFVDGVFVPDGRRTVKVSSAGHIFEGCPDTSGWYWTQINNTALVGDTGGPYHLSVVDGQTFGTESNPAIIMHSNTGITFDLDSLRNTASGSCIERFTAVCGISETALYSFYSDFYVLVDGRVRFKLEKIKMQGQLREIDIKLTEKDRFLTLIAADGGDSNATDWCFYGRPVLELEHRQYK